MNNDITLFIAGIDTDAGKSYATGWLANYLSEQGRKVVTQKFIQTGCTEYSEDIEIHRRIMDCGTLDVDINHTTAPVIFTYPASAQLAATKDGKEINLDLIDQATGQLHKTYDTVLIEGAGGLMVPITDTFFTIDYIVSRHLPVALVTNSRLGSINHTILSLEALKARDIKLPYLLYNHHFDIDPIISADTHAWISRYLKRMFPETTMLDVPNIKI